MYWYDRYWGLMPLENSGISKRKAAKLNNNQEFCNLFENFFTISQDLYEWTGLPDTCDARMLERCLVLYGKAMIARVDGAYMTLGAAPGAEINPYGYPLRGFGWGLNGLNKNFALYVPGADNGLALRKASDGATNYPNPEAVVCYDNVDGYPYVSYIINAAQRMADLLRSCDVAVANLKAPYIVACDEQQVNSIKDAFQRRDENVALILTSKSISLDSLQVMPTNVTPETLKAFWQQYRNIESQLLETLGVESNDNTDKKERLLVDEVNANNEVTKINRGKRLKQREIFCERVNDCFPDLHIGVKLRREEETEDADLEDVGRDEQLDEPV